MNHIGNILHTNNFDNNNMSDMQSDIGNVDDLFSDDILLSPEEVTPNSSSNSNIDAETVRKLQQMITSMKDQLHTMEGILAGTVITNHMAITPTASATTPSIGFLSTLEEGEVIEGTFTGVEMLGNDGKNYPMSPNYASKSKLVQGDRMKLTISPSGSFIYKQIGPVERRHMRGNLMYDAVNNQWSVLTEGMTYKILTASVTFHKGAVGSDVSVIVPASGDSEWAAVEHII